MLSSLFSPILQKFFSFPLYLKLLVGFAAAWLLVVAWPVMVAGVFGLMVFATIQNSKTRLALTSAMLVPALVMEGYWAGTLLGSFNGDANQAVVSPSKVAVIDHNNQIQGAKSEKSPQVRVVQALSGDTVEVEDQGQQFTVRLVGINAPQPGSGANAAQCFGDESKMFLNSLLENRMVEVIEDAIAGDLDEGGSRLRYVRMKDGTKVNELMLEAGLAREDNLVDYEQKDIFVKLAESSDQNNKGLWASCADDGQPKVTPVPSTFVTPTPRSSQPEPTGVVPINPNN